METLLVQILTKLKTRAKLYPELETLARSSSKTHTESSYTFRCMCWPGPCCSDTKHADGTFPGSKLPRCFVCPYGIILKCFSVKCNCGYHCPYNVTFQSHCWWENSWWPELSSYLLLNWDGMSIRIRTEILHSAFGEASSQRFVILPITYLLTNPCCGRMKAGGLASHF